MMSVAVGIPCLRIGGTEMQTLHLVRALVLEGYEVRVICYFEYDNDVVAEFERCGSKVTLLDYSRSMPKAVFVSDLAKEFRSIQADVVHIQYMTPGALAVLAARLAGVKRLLATVHQPYTEGHGIHAKILLRCSAFFCSHFIAVSQSAEQSWFGSSQRYAYGDETRLPAHFTLYNAVDVRRIRELCAEGHEQAEKSGRGAFVFGFLGRLSHEKGADLLFDAFDVLSRKHEQLGLLVVGDGPERKRIEDRYSRTGWWGDVTFKGLCSWQEAMTQFSSMDALVVPSRFEGFGLSAVEALAAGKPVIASECGGLSEIIENGISGLIFPAGDTDALVAAMERLLNDRPLRSRLEIRAAARADEFDVGRFNRNVAGIYKRMFQDARR
ncbi:glycosyltransferase family 4 protein [Prosthecochloris sp. GSB1]|uniref:glycosyltransferase family 4 protein n=1 Tax=Prosthecochloris sp. GSB1 TaxID=281093 RepID=UPI00142D7439|nr:glycosyltransferase family 4 protein [Prosthecochloris sp. GSB1]